MPDRGRAHRPLNAHLTAQDPPGRRSIAGSSALVVAINSDETVNLVIWDEQGSRSFRSFVLYGTERYEWRWPPRV